MTLLERVLRHERALIIAGLSVITILCWAWIGPMAVDMYGAMTGPSAWMMTTTWDTRHIVLLWAMWAVMMAGMMLPSASPILLLYAQALRRRSAENSVWNVYAMAAGYLIVWTAFSVAATLLQRLLSEWLLLTPMMETARPSVTAAVLFVAGAYQLTPLKTRCLHHCRSPLSFVMQHWRHGIDGAFRMGLEHGLYCLGCCWALMLLLFAGGVMNLYVIVALTILVLLEKVAPFGHWIARVSGVAFIAWGVWLLT